MKYLIKKILKEETSKKKDICNIMSVDTYEEGIKLLENHIGTIKENPEMWEEATIEIRKELDEYGMTGDSEVDESDTWWAAIQSTICR